MSNASLAVDAEEKKDYTFEESLAWATNSIKEPIINPSWYIIAIIIIIVVIALLYLWYVNKAGDPMLLANPEDKKLEDQDKIGYNNDTYDDYYNMNNSPRVSKQNNKHRPGEHQRNEPIRGDNRGDRRGRDDGRVDGRGRDDSQARREGGRVDSQARRGSRVDGRGGRGDGREDRRGGRERDDGRGGSGGRNGGEYRPIGVGPYV